MSFSVRPAALRAAGLASVATLAVALAAQTGAAAAAPVPARTTATKVPAATAAPGLLASAALPTGGRVGKVTLPSCALTGYLGRGEALTRPDPTAPKDDDAPCGLLSLGIPPNGQQTSFSGAGTFLVLQADGNLVEYETTTGSVLFTSGTSTGKQLVYQTDGNLVLYDDAGKALFNTRTAGDTRGTFFSSYGNGQLLIQADTGEIVTLFGKAVTPGPGVVNAAAGSPNGQFRLVVQSDGNVVAYNNETGLAFWSTKTPGQGKVRFAAQSDGNLVLYAYPSKKVVWQSRTANTRGPAYYQLDMQDDGNIVLYLTDGVSRLKAVWATYTKG